MNLNKIKIGKLNILDISIILIILVFVCIFVSTKININEQNTVAVGNNQVGTNFSYTISVEGLSKTSEKILKIGDDVYDKISGTYIGKISNIEINDAQGILEKDNGEVILAKVPGKIDVKLTIETNGTIKNSEYLANGLIRIMVGNLKEIKTKYLMCFGTVSSIER